MKRVYLKKGREKPLLNRHPWIFSGAIAKRDSGIEDGRIVEVVDYRGGILGSGYYNSATQISVRMLSFGPGQVDREYLARLMSQANKRREEIGIPNATSAYRLIFSEGDFFPGLIVDQYGDHLVVQLLTLGIELLRDEITELLKELFKPQSIYERSEHSGRALEGLAPRSGQIDGLTPDDIIFNEGEMRFHVDVKNGQKTGFYLDQRDNRRLVRGISRGKKMLNLFSYTGGFSVAALNGGAQSVISVDSSIQAHEMAKRNAALNGAGEAMHCIHADAFDYLRGNTIDSNLIVIDPPAFVKSREDVQRACRGYKDINLQAAAKCPQDTLLLTCSCSRFIDMGLFQKVVFSAMADAGRNATILNKSHHAPDHPVSVFAPETEYLKSLLLHVE